MRRISTIFAACLVVAFSGAAVALASSGKGNGDSVGGGSTTNENTTSTSTTGTTTTPGQGIYRRSRQILGRVTAVEATAKKFDLRVSKRRGAIRRGAVLTITTTDATRYKGLTGFDAITVGKSYKVKVRRAADGTFVAATVERKRIHHRGVDDHRHGNDHRRGNDDSPNHDSGDHRGGDEGNSGSGNSGRR